MIRDNLGCYVAVRRGMEDARSAEMRPLDGEGNLREHCS
jgi:hypothetical protein